MLRMTKMLGSKLVQAVCRDRVELLIEVLGETDKVLDQNNNH